MKVVEEEVKAASVEYIITVEYKSGKYPIVFWYDFGDESYENMSFLKGRPTGLLDEEVEKIKWYALDIWKNTDVFLRINRNLIKRTYLES